MHQNPTTGGRYRAVCTVEVHAKLYAADEPGRLIEGDTDDLAAARYAHEGMKCAQILHGLSMLAYIASHANAEQAAANTCHNLDLALEYVAALALDLSDHALLCLSELHQLYEKKGGGTVNISIRPDKGNTHHDTAAQCLLIINSLWMVLSLAGHDGVDQQDESELAEALNVYGSLGLLFTNTLYAQVEEMELERREQERKGGE